MISVSYTHLDVYKRQVYIETYLENNKVVCNIYGYEIHDPGHRVEFESVWVSTIGKPAAKVTEDPNMYEDVYKRQMLCRRTEDCL